MDSQDQSQADGGGGAEVSEAAEWLLAERTVYALQTAYGPRGQPQLVNRWSFNVHGGPGATEAELKAVAQLARSAPDLFAYVLSRAKRDPIFAKGAEKDAIHEARALVAKALGQ